MHPIERLRYVARAGDVPAAPLVREAAAALAAFADDPMELLTACKQLIERRPACGPLVWVAARMLTGSDPSTEAWDAVEALERDRTGAELAHALPADSTVLVLGSPELTGLAVRERPDVEVLVADTIGEGYGLLRWLDDHDHVGVDIPAAGVGAAAAAADLVVLEAETTGDRAALARAGSRSAAAVARHAGVGVWLVAGVGRVLPDRMWEGVLGLTVDGDPWDADLEVVPLDLVDLVIGPGGAQPVAELPFRIDCPVAPELFR
ncbi:MAG: hypothetical protein GWN79_27235 [Actinobacteria bacterium]|nr:hypothetical protein [Actinomycetota bacterium]NIS33811.1 hypothetical protein [Actinomycetota bacterium]NIT98873.1 hypothetical protein [Actinomycetota bacterium]NIU22504.1 hypothetical protein [Actinomycetota bacterium]NIU67330.1 hypothetical protein [Actinomycetota bacterium]